MGCIRCILNKNVNILLQVYKGVKCREFKFY